MKKKSSRLSVQLRPEVKVQVQEAAVIRGESESRIVENMVDFAMAVKALIDEGYTIIAENKEGHKYIVATKDIQVVLPKVR